MGSVIRVLKGGIEAKLFLRLFEHGEVIKENNVRKVFRGEVGADGVFVKLFKKRMRRARREWFYAERMAKVGLPVPTPLALGEYNGQAFIGLQEIPGVREMGPFLRRLRGELTEREFLRQKRGWIRRVAELVRRMHDSGFYHADMQGGNILLGRDGGVWFVDLHRMRKGRVSKELRKRSLGRLVANLRRVWCEGDEVSLLEGYGAPPEWSEDVLEIARRILQKRLQSRTRRCMMNSSSFCVSHIGSYRVFHRREIKAEEAITIAQNPPENYFVKRYRGSVRYVLKATLGLGRARNAWVAGNGLCVRRFPTAKPIALVEKLWLGFIVESALILERLPLTALNRFVEFTRLSPDESRSLAVSLARFVKSLHDGAISQRDLKGHNILVEDRGREGEERWRFYLVDLDGVSFRPPPEQLRLKNFAQLDVTVPDGVSLTDRGAFLKEYFGEDVELKEIARKVVRYEKGMTRWWKLRRDGRVS